MMFRSAVVATLAATAAAHSITPEGVIPANSKAGNRLMSKARALEQNQNYQQQGDQEITWMVNYSIKYMGCSSLIQVNREAGGEDDPMLYTQNLVKFALCPDGVSYSQCGDGDAQYVVNMDEFIDTYTEMKMDAQEQACEYVRESCYCENANDDEACENQCYADAGMSGCIQYEGEEEFEIQRYLECAELEGGNNNNNGGNYNYNNNNNGQVDRYRQYWVGPTCSEKDGKSINMAVFMDAGCSTKAGSGVYEAFNYGQSLPFESESMIETDAMISCLRQDENQNQNYNNNQNQNQNYNQDYEVAEICEQAYETAAKCETGLSNINYFYPDTTGCQYINNILPKLEKATRKISKSSGSSGSNGTATAFAVIFFLTSCVLGAYSFFLYRKIHRAKVNLSHSEGMAMA